MRCSASPDFTTTPGRSTWVTMLSVWISTPRCSRPWAPFDERWSPNPASTSFPPSKSRIRADLESISRKSSLSTRLESSAICPAISTPVGPPPTTTKVSQPFRLSGSRLELGHLEGPEDPSPQLERVVDRLHPGRPARELVVAEVGLAGARRHDQAVVGKLEEDPVGPHHGHGPPLQVEPAHLGELDLDVPVAVKHPAQRWGDLALGEDPGRHLVEQGLEEVMVDAVHQGDLDRRPAQGASREQAAETSSHDHDAMGIGAHDCLGSVRLTPTRPPPAGVVVAQFVYSLRRSLRMIRAAASIRARWEKACGKFPRWRPVPVSNSSA